MKLKKTISLMMVFVFSVLLAGSSITAATKNTAKIPVDYILCDEDGSIVKTGSFNKTGISARYSFDVGGVTVHNGQTLYLSPSHNPAGLYAPKGTVMNVKYELDHNANHTYTLYRRASMTAKTYEVFTHKGFYSTYSVTYISTADKYYFAAIKNLSSDSFEVVSADIDF